MPSAYPFEQSSAQRDARDEQGVSAEPAGRGLAPSGRSKQLSEARPPRLTAIAYERHHALAWLAEGAEQMGTTSSSN